MRIIKCCLVIVMVGFLLNLPLAYANDAPVEDLGAANSQLNAGDDQTRDVSSIQQDQPVQTDTQTQQPNDNDAVTRNATSEERLARLEQQVSNMANMNLPQQMNELRQEIQQLNGRLQVQQHDIKILSNQQRSFYQDLNRRLQVTKQPEPQTLSQTPTVQNPGSNNASAYRSAFNLLVHKKYDDAMSAFQNYVNAHPQGTFVPNAYYWMGELYLKKQDTDMAVKSFTRVIKQYPNSNKIADAKLKLAIIHIHKGKAVQARQELKVIKRQYSGSTAAQLASIQLQRME